ncbi:MAG: hypothetical protein JKX88_05115, partial [Marinicaulis sp.]|nr:hypothetical protein [Marinicaulis sp.]
SVDNEDQANAGNNAANNGGSVDTDDSVSGNDAAANNGSTASDDQANQAGDGNQANDGGSVTTDDSVDNEDQANGGTNAANNGGSVDDNDASDGGIVANDDSEVDVDQSTDNSVDNEDQANGGTNAANNGGSIDNSTTDNSNTFTLTIGDVQLNTASLSAQVTGASIGGGGLLREQNALHPGGSATGNITSDVRGNRGLISTNNNTGIGSLQSSQNVNVGTVNNGGGF